MKWLYVDASTLVSIAVTDPSREREAMRHIRGYGGILTSDLSRVECQAGLCSQLQSQADLLLTAEQNLNRILSRMLTLGLTTKVTDGARALIKRYRNSIGLRSADALHLATANEFKAALASTTEGPLEYLTSDRKQHQAFTAEGFEGRFLP